jgi:predicted nucleic acid-binding protein
MMNSADGLALLDTNILVYATQEDSPQHAQAKSLRDRALTGEISACISPQVLSEFFVTITRADHRAVQHPISCEQAVAEQRKYCESEHLHLLHPGPQIMERTFWLLAQYPVTGLRFYDMYLVATMLENDVTRVYTYNTRHFAPFAEVEVLSPPEPTPEPQQKSDPATDPSDS